MRTTLINLILLSLASGSASGSDSCGRPPVDKKYHIAAMYQPKASAPWRTHADHASEHYLGTDACNYYSLPLSDRNE